MRRKDSLDLFTQEEYRQKLREIVEEYKTREEKILLSIYRRCEALKEAGFTDKQCNIAIENIKSNVEFAEEFSSSTDLWMNNHDLDSKHCSFYTLLRK